jgi:hypothetical protein
VLIGGGPATNAVLVAGWFDCSCTKRRKEMAKTRVIDLAAADMLIGGIDGLKTWTWGYDDDGGVCAPKDELITNMVGIIERAQTLVSIFRRNCLKRHVTEMTPAEIRKTVIAMIEEEAKLND